MDIAVRTQRLSKHFGEIRAVESLDLEIRRGEMFCLVGPDGAGKTTIIRLLCGIHKPTSGRIELLGLELEKNRGGLKSRIGYLSQKFSLYGDLTVDENIEFFAEIHNVRGFRRQRDELLEFTRMTAFRSRLAENLSGGMKKKLALACTLVHGPDILLLDEPTTGVDVVSRRDFWKILSSLLRTGITIIMATPYLDEAERSSRVALLDSGRLLAVDTPPNIKKLMRGRVIEIVCLGIRQAAALLRDAPGVLEIQAFGDRLNAVVEDPGRDVSGLLDRLRAQGLEVAQWREIPASLENVFISVTRLKTSAETARP